MKNVSFFMFVLSTLLIIVNAKIIDITHTIQPDLPVFGSPNGTGNHYIWLESSIKKGGDSNNSGFNLTTHTGTHCDAPSHFYQQYYDAGYDVTSLDLNVLNGLVQVVEVPNNVNITANVLKSLNISRGVERVLFKTLNTNRRLMHKKEFHSDFVGFKADGATWLVQNSSIKLVGIDYLSISAYDAALPVHRTLLKDRKIHIVEGLNLDDVKAGHYELHCLPLKLRRGDGSPARCILNELSKSKSSKSKSM